MGIKLSCLTDSVGGMCDAQVVKEVTINCAHKEFNKSNQSRPEC